MEETAELKLGERARAAAVAPTPALVDIKAEAESRPGPGNDHEGANHVSDTHEFNLDYTDKKRGLKWTGRFVTKIPTLKQQNQIGRAISILRGHIPPESLDLYTRNLTEMIGTLLIVLQDVPPWAKGEALQEMRDSELVQAIYEGVSSHVARFWGTSGVRPSESAGGEAPKPS